MLLAVPVLLCRPFVCVVPAKLFTPLQISQADDSHSKDGEDAEEKCRRSSRRNERNKERHHGQGQDQPTEEEAPCSWVQVIFQHSFTLAI
jgi:hypothetical protein